MTVKGRAGKTAVIISTVLAAVMLFPFSSHLRDGGTVIYQPVSRIYRVEKLHELTAVTEEYRFGNFRVGTAVYIFGMKVYNEISYSDE
ncbi:MAG TPA: hypothetical protein DDX72_08955 [Ruminococcaceae bacterium]|nr:hypothetical protein [Oscillospiraceae bacterium]